MDIYDSHVCLILHLPNIEKSLLIFIRKMLKPAFFKPNFEGSCCLRPIVRSVNFCYSSMAMHPKPSISVPSFQTFMYHYAVSL